MKQLTNNQLLLKELIKQEYEENANYEKESDFFEFFSASQVLKDFDLSDEEIEMGIKGAGNDGGCDAIYLFLNNILLNEDNCESFNTPKEANVQLIILQAKNTTSFGEDAIMKWKTVSENLLQFSNEIASYQKRYNEDVLQAFEMFKNLRIKLLRSKVKLNIRYIYVSLANEVHPNVISQANELQAQVYAMFPNPNTNITVDFIDSDQLMEKVNSVSEFRFNLQLAESPIAMGKKKDYVSLVNLKSYYDFIVDENGEIRRNIFESNVRDYQGKNSVNSGISETLCEQTGEDFWWLNNGITILASEAILATGKEIVLTNPEIVNGLQTSNEVYNYFKNCDANLTEVRNILVRIIVPVDEESRDRIILATNNQTNIPKSSLRVTDPIHWQIEMYFKNKGLYYDRRKNFYKNQGKKAADIVSVSFLAQCLITLLMQKPDQARARPSTLISNEDSYNRLYVDNQDLNVFYKCALLGKKVQKKINGFSDYSSPEKSDILFYVLYGVVAKYIQKEIISEEDIKCLDVSEISDNNINECIVDIYQIYKKLGGNGRVAKGNELILKIKDLLVNEATNDKAVAYN